MLSVEVREVSDRRAFRRFRDLPLARHGATAQVRSSLSVERRRLSPERNRYFADGDAAYFLAVHGGSPVGRIAAHVGHGGDEDGRFGFLVCDRDRAVAGALMDAVVSWLAGRGCTSVTGPLSFTPEDGAGVLVEGGRHRPVTARPWNPAHHAETLEAIGFAPAGDVRTFRLRAEATPVRCRHVPLAVPVGLEPYADGALQLEHEDGGAVVAVPDVAAAVAGTGVLSAWALARRARRRDWEGAVVTALDGDPTVLVPGLLTAASEAGYRYVMSPWTPDASNQPELVHRLYTRRL